MPVLIMEKTHAFNQLKHLLAQEKQLGIHEPACAVLATLLRRQSK
ncbi:hypothetical protein [Legionella jordanis]|nr:hypothetical protein [Legionella jordanis]